jgi:hypothetical protein
VRLRARPALAVSGVLAVAALTAAPAGATPTCAVELGVAVHGQHVVGDYVTGLGRDTLTWPPAGAVGGAVSGNGGVTVAGGPGPGFHFPNGVAPGASFCNDQARSPGVHF